jgi:FkbM family methyltransferase
VADEEGSVMTEDQTARQGVLTKEHLPGYDTSHTLALVDEAVRSVETSCRELFDEFIVGGSSRSAPVGNVTRAMNRVFESIGFHVARASYSREVQQAQGDRRGKWRSVATLRAMLAAPDDFDGVYRMLADDSSQSIFDWFVRARTAAAFVSEEALRLYPSPGLSDDSCTKAHDFPRRRGEGYVVGGIVVESDLGAILDCFVREQYRLEGRVEVHPGDTVLDLGAYKGESTVWLASQAGPSGRVLAFEPNPAARAFLERNAGRASGAGIGQIQILTVAAGSSRRRGNFVSTAEGCSRLDTGGDIAVDVTTLDDVVSECRLASVDFIKMDIEGGEVEALKGARQTILRHAPRLAISVYHLARDLPDVVATISEVRPDYRFFLSHKSPSLSETMLFASVEDGCRP